MLINRIISTIINEVDESIVKLSLLEDFKLTELPNLRAKFVELLELLVRIKAAPIISEAIDGIS